VRQKLLFYSLEHDTKASSASVSHSFELTTRFLSLKTLFGVCTVDPKWGIDPPSTSVRVIMVGKIVAIDNKLNV